jgi:L-2-hydroxycarboxylate dehydrogenase (NAD+)
MTAHYRLQDLHAFTLAVLEGHGVAASDAAAVAACLLNADRWGVESHGISRLPIYCERIQRGVVNPAPRISIEGRGGVAAVSGDNGPGAVVATHAMQATIQRAQQHGVGVVTVRHSNHYGVAAHYTRMAAEQGCIGLSCTNAPVGMAVWGSREPTLGTNPFAVAMPAGRYGVFSLDMSSSVVARGKILVQQRKGEPIPPGWALDKHGKPTTNPQAAWEGVVLPFGGPKGSGFAMFVELMAGALAGAAMAGRIADQYQDFERPQDVGHCFIAVDIDALMDLAEFESRAETLIAEVKSRALADGFDEILMPGELEARSAAQAELHGLALDDSLVEKLHALGTRAAAAVPRPIST